MSRCRQAGTLERVAAQPGELSGRFEFHASGVLVKAPEDETGRVAVTGSFTGTLRTPDAGRRRVPRRSAG